MTDDEFPRQDMRPVVLIHLTARPDSDVAWCGPFRVGDYGSLPARTRLQQCPLCATAAHRR
jgi:hypothetical protein